MLKIESLDSDQLAQLLGLAYELNSTLQKSNAIKTTLAKGIELSGCRGCCLVLFNERQEGAPEIYSRGVSEEFLKNISTLSKDLVRKVASDISIQCFDHMPGSLEEGIHSIICFSLVCNEKTLGLLYFFHYETSSLPEKKVQLLKLFAVCASTAIENAILYDLKEQKIRQLNILNEATVSLASESDIKSLFQKLADYALFLLRSEAAFLLLLPSESSRIEQVYVSGNLKKDSLSFQPSIAGALYEIMNTHSVLNVKGNEQLKDEGITLPFSLPNLRSLLAVPVTYKGTSIGILILVNKTSNLYFGHEDEDLLLTYGFQAALSIENARLHEHTKRLAVTDGLTGLFNHREFQKKLKAEVRRGIRYKRVFSLLMIDIDHFKSFNDTYGHPVGDDVLKCVAQTIKESVRDIDITARYGGEEFVVILPETSKENALVVAERVRSKIQEKSVGQSLGNGNLPITVSIGVASFPEDTSTSEKLIANSDQALYQAKRKGRNRIDKYEKTLT